MSSPSRFGTKHFPLHFSFHSATSLIMSNNVEQSLVDEAAKVVKEELQDMIDNLREILFEELYRELYYALYEKLNESDNE